VKKQIVKKIVVMALLLPLMSTNVWSEQEKPVTQFLAVDIGAGLHSALEDQPYAIGRAISDWYRRLDK